MVCCVLTYLFCVNWQVFVFLLFFWQIFPRCIENVPDFHFRNLVTLPYHPRSPPRFPDCCSSLPRATLGINGGTPETIKGPVWLPQWRCWWCHGVMPATEVSLLREGYRQLLYNDESGEENNAPIKSRKSSTVINDQHSHLCFHDSWWAYRSLNFNRCYHHYSLI